MQKSSDIKLSREQIIMMVISSASGAYTYNFTWIIPEAGRAVWIAGLISILPIIPLILWLSNIRQKNPEGTVFEFIEDGLGKFISKCSIIFYYVIVMISAVILMNLFIQTVKIYFLKDTPAWVLILLITTMCTVFVGKGIKVFGMFCELIVIYAIINYYAGFSFALVKGFKISNLVPLFDTTLPAFLKAVWFIMGNLSECLLLLMVIIDSVPDSKRFTVWVAKGLVLWAIIFAASGVTFIGILGIEHLAGVTGSGIEIAKLIQVGDFIRGLEIFIFSVYVIQAVAKISIFLYSMHHVSLKLIAKMKIKTHLVVGSIFVLTASIIIDSYTTAYFLSTVLYTYVLLPFSIVLLILAAIGVAAAKRRKTVR